MSQTLQRTFLATAVTAFVAGALLTGCEKKTATIDTPAGTSTTTSVSATPGASEAMGKAADSAGRAMDKVGDAVGDAAITAKVKTALLADAEVKGLKIDVDTHDGVVTLTGELAGRGNVDRAATIAKGIDGVKAVQNRLTVKS